MILILTMLTLIENPDLLLLIFYVLMNGLGGGWIKCGLPTFLCIERKPEDGFEIQNICSARSQTMMHIKLVVNDAGYENNGT